MNEANEQWMNEENSGARTLGKGVHAALQRLVEKGCARATYCGETV
jgi:hypothetical protein